jgi:hypothetical protein
MNRISLLAWLICCVSVVSSSSFAQTNSTQHSKTTSTEPLFPNWKSTARESPDVALVVPPTASEVPMRRASAAAQKVGERYMPQGMKLTNAFVVDLNGDGKSELLILASNRHRTDISQAEYRSPGFVLLNPDSGAPKVVPIKQNDAESGDLWETNPIAYRYGGKTCIAAAFYFRAEPGIVVACTDAQWRWTTARRYPLAP